MANKTIRLHDVMSIDVRNIQRLELDSGKVFFTRDIVILDKDGEEITIEMFGDAEANLKVEM